MGKVKVLLEIKRAYLILLILSSLSLISIYINFHSPYSKMILISRNLKNFQFNTSENIDSYSEKRKCSIMPVWNCSLPFITVFDGGRLGNQICQFMALYHFRIEFGMRVVVSRKMENRLREVFYKVPVPQLPNSCFNTNTNSFYFSFYEDLLEYFRANIVEENNYANKSLKVSNISFYNFITGYQKQSLNLSNISYYNFITSYPCPIEDLMKYRAKFQSLLKIKDEHLVTARLLLENALKAKNLSMSNTILVGTHVRRTDYILFKRIKEMRLPSESYYRNAFKFYRQKCKNVVFVVISDDLLWSRERLYAPDVIFPGSGNITAPHVDYALLTLCHHHIIGIGTFGLSSAYLGNGSIVVFHERSLTDTSQKYPLSDLLKRDFNCSSTSDFIYLD